MAGAVQTPLAAFQRICEVCGNYMKCLPIFIFLFLDEQPNAKGHKLFCVCSCLCRAERHLSPLLLTSHKKTFILHITVLSAGELTSLSVSGYIWVIIHTCTYSYASGSGVSAILRYGTTHLTVNKIKGFNVNLFTHTDIQFS